MNYKGDYPEGEEESLKEELIRRGLYLLPAILITTTDINPQASSLVCLLYTSDAADDPRVV